MFSRIFLRPSCRKLILDSAMHYATSNMTINATPVNYQDIPIYKAKYDNVAKMTGISESIKGMKTQLKNMERYGFSTSDHNQTMEEFSIKQLKAIYGVVPWELMKLEEQTTDQDSDIESLSIYNSIIEEFNQAQADTLNDFIVSCGLTQGEFLNLCCALSDAYTPDVKLGEDPAPKDVEAAIIKGGFVPKTLTSTGSPTTGPDSSEELGNSFHGQDSLLSKLIVAAQKAYEVEDFDESQIIKRFSGSGEQRKSLEQASCGDWLAYHLGLHNDTATETRYKKINDQNVAVYISWGKGAGTYAHISCDNDKVIIAFKGTSTISDLFLDAQYMLTNLSEEQHHRTNPLDADGVADGLSVILEKFKWQDKELYTTGHSLGGTISKEVGFKLNAKSLSITPMADLIYELDEATLQKRKSYLASKNITLYYKRDFVTGLTGANHPETCSFEFPAQGVFSSHGIKTYVDTFDNRALMKSFESYVKTLDSNEMAKALIY